MVIGTIRGHYIVFDNKTAQAVEDRIGRCAHAALQI
jgi:hypothetical protein